MLISSFLSHEQFIISGSMTVVSAKKQTKALVMYQLIHISFINSMWPCNTLISYRRPNKPEVPCFSVHLWTSTNVFSFHEFIWSLWVWIQSEASSGLDKIYSLGFSEHKSPWVKFDIDFMAMSNVDIEKWIPLGLNRVDIYLGSSISGKRKNESSQLMLFPVAYFIQLSAASSFPLLHCGFPFNLTATQLISTQKRY